MRKNIIAVIGCIFMTMPAMGHWKYPSAIINYFGGRPAFIGCGETNTQGCIGKKLRENNCSVYDANQPYFTFMLARLANANGAYFCPTTFLRESSGNGASIFAEPTGNRECRWLCREGWTGYQCNTPTNEYKGACDVWPFLRTNYDDVYGDSAYVNIEWSFHYVRSDAWWGCTARSGQRTSSEHDILLAINRFLDSGNGAMVRLMEFSARYDKGKKRPDLQVYPAQNTSDILLCKPGYKQNAGYTDCEPINPSECNQAIMSQKMCSGWDLSLFNEDIHTAELVGGCYKYRCKQANYAFASAFDHTCIECAKGLRGGSHPKDGTCVKCDTGRVFNAEDPANEYCPMALGLTHSDMIWGKDKTKGDYKTILEIKQQCWTKTSPAEYRDCVLRIESSTNENAE